VYVANTLLHKTYSGIFSVTNSNKWYEHEENSHY
jgi:hypothetical protein